MRGDHHFALGLGNYVADNRGCFEKDFKVEIIFLNQHSLKFDSIFELIRPTIRLAKLLWQRLCVINMKSNPSLESGESKNIVNSFSGGIHARDTGPKGGNFGKSFTT